MFFLSRERDVQPDSHTATSLDDLSSLGMSMKNIPLNKKESAYPPNIYHQKYPPRTQNQVEKKPEPLKSCK